MERSAIMKIGFIGTGNMASALIRGFHRNFENDALALFLYDKNSEKAAALAKECPAKVMRSSEELIRQADIVFIAVKPDVVKPLLASLQGVLAAEKPLIVSIASGVTLDNLEAYTGGGLSIIRIMPNINALVGASVTALCANQSVKDEEKKIISNLMQSVGMVFPLEEKFFSVFVGIAGSAPAYAYLFIDALARGALKNGLDKKTAVDIAAAALLGSAQMLLKSGSEPWPLIDTVSSPGGTTVAGICKLEEKGFVHAVIAAVDETIKKDEELNS
jgi:pyrroline-5-carboxylate reductase